MAQVEASTVMRLRKVSGQGMMDCKRALEEAGGNLETALEILRKKGLSTLSKRADRQTLHGMIVGADGDEGRVSALATLCCETDFVARSDDFVAASKALGRYALACDADSGVERLLAAEIDGKAFSDILTEAVSKTGEKISVGDYARYRLDGPGALGIYVHFNSRIGAMVELRSAAEPSDPAALATVAADVAMHITASSPLALEPGQIDSGTLEKEKAIFAEQIKNKPPQIVERIVEGKMKKFFAENCLLSQPFVKDDSKTVDELLRETAGGCGGKLTVSRFVRFGVG
jgi:elongation factor Ts